MQHAALLPAVDHSSDEGQKTALPNVGWGWMGVIYYLAKTRYDVFYRSPTRIKMRTRKCRSQSYLVAPKRLDRRLGHASVGKIPDDGQDPPSHEVLLEGTQIIILQECSEATMGMQSMKMQVVDRQSQSRGQINTGSRPEIGKLSNGIDWRGRE